MSERQPGPYDSVARKWHALAERRRMHVIELRESGRWKHYYTAEGLLEALREAVGMRDAWAKIAGLEQQVEAPAADWEADNGAWAGIAGLERQDEAPAVERDADSEANVDGNANIDEADVDNEADVGIEAEPFRQAG
jgi:hypothetical protein